MTIRQEEGNRMDSQSEIYTERFREEEKEREMWRAKEREKEK